MVRDSSSSWLTICARFAPRDMRRATLPTDVGISVARRNAARISTAAAVAWGAGTLLYYCQPLTLMPHAIGAAASNWRLDRIAPVDRTILRLGAYELLGEPETPAAVVLDEAVEMAKRFGEADSPAFVNGVLDGILRAAEPAK